MFALNVCDKAGDLHFFAPFTLASLLCYPRDTQKQKRLYTIVALKMLLYFPSWKESMRHNKSLMIFLVDSLPILRDSPPYDQVVDEAARDSSRFWVAGEIVLLLLAAATYHPEYQATQSSAVRAMSWYLKNSKDQETQKLPSSYSALWKFWSNFKPVAHLYAAWRYSLCDDNRNLAWRPPEIVPRDACEILSLGEIIRSECERLRFLNPQEMYRAPHHFKAMNVRFKAKPLSEDWRKAFEVTSRKLASPQ